MRNTATSIVINSCRTKADQKQEVLSQVIFCRNSEHGAVMDEDEHIRIRTVSAKKPRRRTAARFPSSRWDSLLWFCSPRLTSLRQSQFSPCSMVRLPLSLGIRSEVEEGTMHSVKRPCRFRWWHMNQMGRTDQVFLINEGHHACYSCRYSLQQPAMPGESRDHQ